MERVTQSGISRRREFVSHLQGLIEGDRELSEVPISQRRPKPLLINEYEIKTTSRDEAIYSAYMSGGLYIERNWRLFWVALCSC